MRTKVAIFITIFGKIDSRKLFKELEDLDINVVDLGDKTLVFGKAELQSFALNRTLIICSKYSDSKFECTLTV